MRRSDGFLNIVISKYGLAAALASVLLVPGGALAQPQGPVSLQFTVPIPPTPTNKTGGMYAFDISWINQSTQTFYLGDRSNAAVDVVDAASGTFISQITAKPAFAGVALNTNGTANNNASGPNGVATGIIDGQTCLFVGDTGTTAGKTHGRVVSFKLPAGTQVSDVSTGGTFRADELAFDPKDSLVMVANNAETPFPFATLLKVSNSCKLTIVHKITFNPKSGVDATNGAEQPVWDPATGLFYQSIPQTGPNPQNGLVIAVSAAGKIVSRFHVDLCQPAGLVLDPVNGDLLLGCSSVFDTAGGLWTGADANTATPYQVVMDPTDGFIQAYVPGIGGSDEVTYNANDGNFYTGSSGSPYAPHAVVGSPPPPADDQGAAVLGIIDGGSFSLRQQVPTFNVPNVIDAGPPVKTVHVSGASHSVAADDRNGWVFVPAPANNALPGCLTGCIQVFSR